jgi:diacylglycerol kinase family enzyme
MRVAVLLNPISGRAATRRMTKVIKSVFHDSDIHWFNHAATLESFLRNPVRASTEAKPRACPSDTPDLLLAVGGDGTAHHLVNSVADLGAPLGVIPCGRANDFARALNMPFDPFEACVALRSPRLVPVDLISVNGRFLLTCGGLGLVTAASERADGWRRGSFRFLARTLGRLCYPAAALLEIIHKEESISISTGDSDAFHEISSFVVSNQPRFGGSFSVSPRASHTDGEIDICEIPAAGTLRERAHICLSAWRGGGMNNVRGVRSRSGGRFVVRTAIPCTFTGDGEPMSRAREFVIKVHPGRLIVATPATDRSVQAA